ncbi:Transposase [Porphyromonas macacae]|uniref:Transposase n=1 Tax=Porphyromonas macacae TaxID=28115 RepID=A0A379EAT3_9PORP|nr:IS4 family transposase [Porphyromonas macacae]SUB88035.1 Transposase [Porphyromonas macacae]SUB88042.1 Transposase [Porphyromonas macacae]SUB88112.1 Transposase [Porphyromonas macacae]SUB88353.1 Transposase [Porphyromonas macacae]SUB89785.1 Transposase [Porphyromonas macacae]
MNKGNHFLGQPLYSQVLSLLNKSTVLQCSRRHSGERYVKSFDAWTHLVVMLYAVIHRFDSLREITASLQADARKLSHLGICNISARSTLSDANKRRPQVIFADIYRDLYARYSSQLSSDSREKRKEPQWMKRLQIIDSTTITLFSNLIFKGAGRNPKRGKKKGGIKVHTVIHANEGVPSDIRFTSAATHDSFMLCPCNLAQGAIIAMDRAYIDYAKFEQMTQRGIIYVTKMKTGLNYTLLKDEMIQTPEGLMQVRIQDIVLTKKVEAGEPIEHRARIISYPDVNKKKLISLLTNDLDPAPRDIIEIYRKRWAIELLFKQIKQNFPLKYFYGESANAIQIQIWVTLIANLLLMVMKRQLKRPWSFSGLATLVRIVLMYYVDFYSLFEHPESDWEAIFEPKEAPPEPNLFGWGAY